MTNAMRTHSPLMSFIPCVYYYTWPMDHKNVSVFKAWPDLFLTMDLPMYWFRNEKQGTGACAEERCVPYWGPTTRPPGHEPRSGGCLAGPCAEETLGNLFDEVQDVLAALTAPGRKVLHLGMYATGHTTFGTPTEPYVRAFPELALSHPNVRGVWSGCGMLAPCGPIDSATSCEGNGGYDDTYLRWLCAKGCAIAESYGELAMREGLGLGMGLE